jgi:hypothetical protein
MSEPSPTPNSELTRSQKKFLEAPEQIQRLIRQVLGEERQVMHLSNRVGSGIHQKILDQVKSVVR